MRGSPYSRTRRRGGRCDRGSTMAEAIVALVLFSILLVLALRLTSEVSISQGRRNISESLEQTTSEYLAEARLADCARYLAVSAADPAHPCAVPLNSHSTRPCDAAETADKPASVHERVCLDYESHSGAVVDVWDLYRPPTWCATSASDHKTAECMPVPTRIVVAAHPGRLHSIERSTVGRSVRRVDPFWGRITCTSADRTKTATVTENGAAASWEIVIKDGAAFVVGDARAQQAGVAGVSGATVAASAEPGGFDTSGGSWC